MYVCIYMCVCINGIRMSLLMYYVRVVHELGIKATVRVGQVLGRVNIL